jgi:hypothetical protein
MESAVNAPKFSWAPTETILVLLGKLSGGADDFIEKPGQTNGLGIEFELTGLDLREVQNFVDEAQEVGPGGIHKRSGSSAFSVPNRAAHRAIRTGLLEFRHTKHNFTPAQSLFPSISAEGEYTLYS